MERKKMESKQWQRVKQRRGKMKGKEDEMREGRRGKMRQRMKKFMKRKAQ